MENQGNEEKGKSFLSQTRELLRRYNLRVKKSLGQHFLVDSAVLRHILAAAEVQKTDLVVEVGSGLGVLTRELAKVGGHVIAVELDDNLAGILREELKPSGNVAVINRDILQLDPGALLVDQVIASLPEAVDRSGYKVVANLPYYITSAVLRHFLTAKKKPRLIVVMVQKEVARQITAPPGEMSVLAVSVQFYGRPQIVSYVPARSFYPAPEVDSAILKIDVYPSPVVPVEEKSFFELVRAGFSSARKQLVNSLANRLKIPKSDVLELLGEAEIAPQRRAETLSLEEWGKLWQIYRKRKDADPSSPGKN